jgi:hypothetical protein
MSELYTYSHEHVSGDLDAFLSGIMDENGLPGDLLEDEHYMCYSEGTSLLLKRKPVSGVTLSVSNFTLRRNIILPTNATNKYIKNV